jgi:hypothetical protein
MPRISRFARFQARAIPQTSEVGLTLFWRAEPPYQIISDGWEVPVIYYASALK